MLLSVILLLLALASAGVLPQTQNFCPVMYHEAGGQAQRSLLPAVSGILCRRSEGRSSTSR